MEKENNLQALTLVEHIRLRPGVYIGKTDNCRDEDNGIYTLLKVLINNSVDEFRAGHGELIEVSMDATGASVRDYGRGIPFDSIVPLVTHDGHEGILSENPVSCKSVGLGGVGLCAVMALSQEFRIISYRGGIRAMHHFEKGKEVDSEVSETSEPDGLRVIFHPDYSIFGPFSFCEDYVDQMIRLYSQLNMGLKIVFDDCKYGRSRRNEYLTRDGLRETLDDITGCFSAPETFHLVGKCIEIAFHAGIPCSRIESYVNGHRTKAGGPHQDALMEALSDHFGTGNFVAVMNIMLDEPVFVDQARNELANKYMWERYNDEGGKEHGQTIRKYIKRFVSRKLDSEQKNDE